MKYFATILLIVFISGVDTFAQDKGKKSRRERRLEKEQIKKAIIKNQLENKNFIFEASHANPLSGSTVYLTSSYDIHVKNDSVYSYLPYFGVAYHVDYGARNSAFEFNLPITDYQYEHTEKGYTIKFKAKNKMDLVEFHLNISELGYTTLQINSTHRQSISYYGEILKQDETADEQ
jgi:hypothetical protein